ncbi:hypothetical protein SLS62_008824 [Diatrype stigma]|uniref:Uncharacterized protein n=1 Tax=Diatrype stigma TaxID=117547 RepID=A0AAN9US93_9PEZI
MATHHNKLQRFEDAMKAVYGPFGGLTVERAAEWTPPTCPGAGGHRGRYLWTDAFGVVNLITLSREKKQHETEKENEEAPVYLELAKRLAQTVHDVLGRTRDGSFRLPGATDARPLDGGLRIGKLDETGPDGDGQYHHYLTLWMFALNRLALAAGEPRWNDLAVQLAKAIHPRFVVEGSMVWKISADMRRVLVGSKGHLDDVTGLVVFRILQETAKQQQRHSGGATGPSLQSEIEHYEAMVARSRPLRSSSDPLDLGMSLWVAHLERDAPWSRELAEDGLGIAERSFLRASLAAAIDKASSRRFRLAFRDFGACLGIKCYASGGSDDDNKDHESLISGADAVAEAWSPFLLDEEAGLKPITLVMGAAALIPGAFCDGYLDTQQ